MISVLCPTRGRPDLFRRMVDSAFDTGAGQDFEILAYVDIDDATWQDYKDIPGVNFMYGDPVRVGVAWNKLAAECVGSSLMMGNDDLVFKTDNWVDMIEAAIRIRSPHDGIYVAWANDGAPDCSGRCAFPIVSRTWYEALGYFTPECFNFLWNDSWIADIGRRLSRMVYVFDVEIEHRHFTFKKADMDETYARHRKGAGSDVQRRNDRNMFGRTQNKRIEAANILRKRMVTEVMEAGRGVAI